MRLRLAWLLIVISALVLASGPSFPWLLAGLVGALVGVALMIQEYR